MNNTTTATRPASQKQRDLISNLLNTRNVAAERAAHIIILTADPATTVREASATIDYLMSRPYPTREVHTDLAPGMYQIDGTMYRVQKSRETGRLYAKRLDTDGATARFTYDPGAIYRLNPEQRMTREQAEQFGVETGICCVCAATLTDPKSIARGIGPVCAKRV